MTLSQSACVIKAHIRSLHDGEGLSWREIKELCYPDVNHETLRRFALTKYVPKDKKILDALGLTKPELSEHEKRIMKAKNKMARKTKEAVLRR